METLLAKTKNKDHSEIEYLRGRVRELEKQVRIQEKQLTRYARMQHAVEDAREAILEAEKVIEEVSPKPEKRAAPCSACEYGEMVIKFDYPELNKKIYACTSCGCTRSK